MLLYYIYFAITYLINIFTPLLLKRRLKLNKEHPIRYSEKLGKYATKRINGKIVWFHVASVGELNSVITLIKEIEKEVTVLITCVTTNSYKVFKKAGFTNSIHQFAPLDTPQIVKKFLDHWQPNLGIFVDSELWPNLLNAASKKFGVINLNARLSNNSANKWGYIKSTATYIYSNFSLVLPCSRYDMQKISQFVPASKIRYIGNLKFCAEGLDINSKDLVKLKKLFNKQIIIVAASTHCGEEEIILSAYKQLKPKFKKAFLIIAPRHTNRGGEIQKLCEQLDLGVSLRSKSEGPSIKQDVYIADTIGEMGLWYSLSEIAIVGGSFVPVGGHNIIEPAKLNNAILVGPYTSNFKDIVDTFKEYRAIIISDAKHLVTNLEKLLYKLHLRTDLADRALKISDSSETVDSAKEIIFSILRDK